MDRLKLFIPFVVFVVIAGFCWYALENNTKNLPAALVDQQLPAFALPILEDPSSIKSNEDIQGEFSLLNVWASWCIPCRQELPFLIELSKQGIPVYGVNAKDEPNDALGMLQRYGNPYTFSVMDSDGRLGLELGITGYPETYLVDANGVVRYKHIGIVDGRSWRDKFLPAMGKGATDVDN